MAIRNDFPTRESAEELGGKSDGFVFETAFAGASLEKSYELVKQFMKEAGYDNLPLPKDAGELERFRFVTRNKQILLFEENGYIHNPIKILFHPDRRKKNMLILKLYNEQAPHHLLRFHGVLPE